MTASENKGFAIQGDFSGSSNLAHEIRDDNPRRINQILIGQGLNLGIVNQYGQLMGEYSRLDDELWLSKPEDEEAVEKCNEGVELASVPFYENIVGQGQASEYVDDPVCDVGVSVKEKASSLKHYSQKHYKNSSPISVLQKGWSCSNVSTTVRSHRKRRQPTKRNSSGGFQFPGTTSSAREHSWAFQSESENSMESSLSDETDEYIPAKQVRTRKISELINFDSNPAAKKCMHCGTTETPQWRTGPMGRKTVCNACGVQYKHGRLYPDYRPLKSPTFDPSLHSNLPKKVQMMRMGNVSERVPHPTPKPKKVQWIKTGNNIPIGQNLTSELKKLETRMGKNSEMGQNLTSEPENFDGMCFGNKNERDQNRAHRAKKFEERREKASDLIQLDCRENQNFDSEVILKPKTMEVVKKCLHCESTKTPQWREGPMGRYTLCNACGVQYRAGRLYPEYRPLKSPTYDPCLHSHLPKKVLQMRMNNAENNATSGN
ncbi:hypothetical protein BVRB_6g141930 [Beta vulgaris subsp. vulgaris]|nr:hypothetical protein BVRB_6g141930 [Beta vulgaris subsp. vulgaris]